MAHTADTFPLLHWIAPRTEHKRLVANNPWLPDACTRAVALFDDKSLHVPAAVLASVHEAAIDYITQAPALVVAASEQSDLALRSHREQVAARFKVVCTARPRLKDLMRFYGLAPQLRILSGRALRPGHYRLLAPVSAIPPSRLAQCIPHAPPAGPAKPLHQIAWLDRIENWRSLAARLTRNPDWIVTWAAANACHEECAGNLHEIIDFACRNPTAFDQRWSYAEATAASERWHTEIAECSFDGAYTPEELSAVADYGPLPAVVDVDDHTFVALRTRPQIFAEGHAMRHCVATYADDVFSGRCWLYSISRNGARVATLELRQIRQRFARAQIKAQCNRRPPGTATAAADRFLAEINALVALAAERASPGRPRQESRPATRPRRRAG